MESTCSDGEVEEIEIFGEDEETRVGRMQPENMSCVTLGEGVL